MSQFDDFQHPTMHELLHLPSYTAETFPEGADFEIDLLRQAEARNKFIPLARSPDDGYCTWAELRRQSSLGRISLNQTAE